MVPYAISEHLPGRTQCGSTTKRCPQKETTCCKSQQPPSVSTLPTAQVNNLVPATSGERVGGATFTRLKPHDKEHLLEQDRALYVGLSRGEKSVGAAAALAQALLVCLRKLRIPIESVSPTSAKFVTAVFFESSGRNKALQRLEGLNFTQNGKIVCPDIARYGAVKPPPKTVIYQIPRPVASSDEIVSALAGHILGGDKALPPFRVCELLQCEIPVRSLLIQFSSPPPSLGRKTVLVNRQVTQLSNSKCILCSATDHTL